MSEGTHVQVSEDEISAISIIIVTLNEEENIRDCLESLIKLDYPQRKHEIVVVDSSTDSTPQIVESYEQVRLVRSDKGFSNQKNAGLKAASYDILAYSDADCIFPENWLRVIDRAFKNPDIATIGGNAYHPQDTGYFGKCVACVGHPAGGAVGFDANFKRVGGGINFAPGCNSVYRRNVLLKVGGFNDNFNEGGEDVDVSRRINQKGYLIDYVPDLTIYHKPRNNLWQYITWNIRSGICMFNIRRPSFIKLIFHPSFPLWSILLFWGVYSIRNSTLLLICTLFFLWMLSIFIPLVASQPYPLLIKRRRKIGINLFTIFMVVPFLIYLRLVCINIGQCKKWLRMRKNL
jgi:cellulose synthase/poly-beta-1,6-N-acetylglucosamine synthase-like glycosyltransferase